MKHLLLQGEYAGNKVILQQTLQDQYFTESRVFGGLQTSLALSQLALDVEYTRMPVYSAKLSLGW
jgi:hypothetical protein